MAPMVGGGGNLTEAISLDTAALYRCIASLAHKRTGLGTGGIDFLLIAGLHLAS